MTNSAHILLLEDDPAIAQTVVYALEREGFAITHCQLVGDAKEQISRQLPDALVLDIGLPDGSGLDFCRHLRTAAHAQRLPILMLSARSEEIDRVLGLELGADDYMAKPFSPRELVARLRALLRRSNTTTARPQQAPSTVWQHDRAGQRIYLQGTALPLTKMEYGLMSCLLDAPARILARDWLFERIWGLDTQSADRTVDAHIKTLRAKLRQLDAGAAQCIVTHRGMGYSFEPGSNDPL